MKIDHDHN